jgi:two-component system response regulator FixJ
MCADPKRISAPVLVVDDDEAVRGSLKFMLELEGLDVRLFEDGEALLRERELPARGCLVVDHKMPRLTGVDVLRRLNARDVHLPAFLITARLTDGIGEAAAEAGFAAVFEKPLHDGGLVEAIRCALGEG